MPDLADPQLCTQLRAAMPDALARGTMPALLATHLLTCAGCRAEWMVLQQVAVVAPKALASPPAPDLTIAWSRLAAALPAGAQPRGKRAAHFAAYVHDVLAAQVRLIGGELAVWSGAIIVLAIVGWFVSQGQGMLIPLLTMPAAMILVLRLWGLERLAVAPEISPTLPLSPLVTHGLRVALGFGSQVVMQGAIAVVLTLAEHAPPDVVVRLWLAPLVCAMSLALLATLALGPVVASIAALSLWLLRLIAQVPGVTSNFFVMLNHLWLSPVWLGAIALVALALAGGVVQVRARLVG